MTCLQVRPWSRDCRLLEEFNGGIAACNEKSKERSGEGGGRELSCRASN